MKTKIIAIVTALAMVFALAAVGSAASGTPTVAVSDGTVNIGESVDVTVSLENNPGIINMLLSLEYDDTVFKITGVKDKGLLGTESHSDNYTSSPYTLFWSNGTADADYTSNGAVVTVTFKVNDTAAAGTYNIGISYDNDDAAIFNRALEKINFAVDGGSITVVDPTAYVTGVSLDRDTLTLIEGVNDTLTASVAPDNATEKGVTWSSDNEAVATVSGGVVTAVSAGTANITVTTVDGGKTDTCAVTVIAPVTGVSLDRDTLTLIEGVNDTLTASVAPDNATEKGVTWSSDNEAVATVLGGVVTAHTAGTANITVTTVDGGRTATCAVTVIAPVTGVTLDKSTLTLVEGANDTLTASVAPDNATEKGVTWSSDNEAVATVSGGVVTAVSAGTANITVTTVDGGKTDTCAVTVIGKTVDLNAPALKVVDAEATSGDTVAVVLELSNNPGFTQFSFTVGYDDEVLTLESITPGAGFASFNVDGNIANNPLTVNGYTASLCSENGTYVTLNFKVSESAEECDVAIDLTHVSALGELDMNTFTTPEYNVQMTDGKVSVSNYIAGDVNGDGQLTPLDLVFLAKYFAGYSVPINEKAANVSGPDDGTDPLAPLDLVLLAKYFAGYAVPLVK